MTISPDHLDEAKRDLEKLRRIVLAQPEGGEMAAVRHLIVQAEQAVEQAQQDAGPEMAFHPLSIAALTTSDPDRA